MRFATLLLLSALAASASALTIDSFADGAYTTTLTAGNSTDTQTALGALGGSRLTYFEVSGNPLAQSASLAIGGGNLIVSQGAGVSTFTSLVYGFGGNLGHVDFTNLKDFQIDFLSSDVVDRVVVNVISNGFGGTAVADTPALPAGPYTLHLDLGTVTPTVNLADVTELRVQIFGRANADYAISEIRAVPEPASLAALAVGGLGLLRRRRR